MEQGSIQEFPIYEPELNNNYEGSIIRNEESTATQEDKAKENSKDERASKIRRGKALILLGLTIFFGEKAFNFFSRNKNIRIDNAIGIVGVANFEDKDFGDKFYDGYLFDLKSAIENNYVNVKLLEDPYDNASKERPYYRNATYDDVVYLHEKYGDDFVNKVVIKRDNTVFHISSFKFVDGRFSVNVRLGLTNTSKIVEQESERIETTGNCDLEFAMDFGIIEKIVDKDSGKKLTYNDVLALARTKHRAKLLRGVETLYGEKYTWDGAVLYYDYENDKVMVHPVRLNVLNTPYVHDLIDLKQSMANSDSISVYPPEYKNLSAREANNLYSRYDNHGNIKDDIQGKKLTYDEIIELYKKFGIEGLKDIIISVGLDECDLTDIICGVVGDRIMICSENINYKKLTESIENGEYFSVKDAMSMYAFAVYSREDQCWINYRHFAKLYEKYGNSVVNLIQVDYAYPLFKDQDSVGGFDFTPYNVTGIKVTEDGIMMSIGDPILNYEQTKNMESAQNGI